MLVVLVRDIRKLAVYTATMTFTGLWLGEDVPLTAEARDRTA